MPKMPNRHFPGIQNGIVVKHFSILAQLIPATDDGNAEKVILFALGAGGGFFCTAEGVEVRKEGGWKICEIR